MAEFNLQNPLENKHDARWMAIGAAPGAPPLRTLTYDPEHPEKFLDLYQASHLGQAAQFELLARLIDKQGLGQGDTFDFVCLIADSTARLGYEVGGRSPLMRQMVLHLDQQLEFLLEQLKTAAGRTDSTWCWRARMARRPTPRRRAADAWRCRARAWPRRWTAHCWPAASGA